MESVIEKELETGGVPAKEIYEKEPKIGGEPVKEPVKEPKTRDLPTKEPVKEPKKEIYEKEIYEKEIYEKEICEKGIKKSDWTFCEPDNLEDILDLVTNISVFLDLWACRSENWSLIQLLCKSLDPDFWNVIAKCVKTKSGVNVVHVPVQELKTKGILEVVCVFCEGLMDLEIPSIYLKYCAGISYEGVLSLIKDVTKIREEAQDLKCTQEMLPDMLVKVLQSSIHCSPSNPWVPEKEGSVFS